MCNVVAMAVKRLEWRTATGGGALAGFIGGLALSVWGVLVAVAQRQDVWLAFKGPASALLGRRASDPGFEPVAIALGLSSRFALAVAWGVLFAFVVHGWSRWATLAFGVLYGVLVWLGMAYALLPLFGHEELARAVPFARAVAEHVLYGVVVAASYLPVQPSPRERRRAAARARA